MYICIRYSYVIMVLIKKNKSQNPLFKRVLGFQLWWASEYLFETYKNPSENRHARAALATRPSARIEVSLKLMVRPLDLETCDRPVDELGCVLTTELKGICLTPLLF